MATAVMWMPSIFWNCHGKGLLVRWGITCILVGTHAHIGLLVIYLKHTHDLGGSAYFMQLMKESFLSDVYSKDYFTAQDLHVFFMDGSCKRGTWGTDWCFLDRHRFMNDRCDPHPWPFHCETTMWVNTSLCGPHAFSSKFSTRFR